MRLPNGFENVSKVDGNKRRNPWRAKVLVGKENDPATGKCKKKYKTLGYYATKADAIKALADPYSICWRKS